MKEIGQYLQNERKKQNLTLEDVADRTKIHIYKLRSIEEGDRAALPAKVFCIGLIKSYARELKVDMDKINQLCDDFFNPKEQVVEEAAPINSIDEEEPTEAQAIGLFQFPKMVSYIAGALVIAGLIGGIFTVVNKLNSYSEEKALPGDVMSSGTESSESKSEDTPSETIAESTPEEPTENEVSKETTSDKAKETTASPAQTEDSKKVEVAEEKPEPATAESETEIETNQSESQPVEVVDTTPDQTSESSDDEVEDEGFSEDNNFSSEKATVVSDNKLVLTALEPVRAEVVWSDGYVQVMLLKSKETKTLVFSTPIVLKINNGGAVQVSYNDQEKKVPGTFNQPIELRYP